MTFFDDIKRAISDFGTAKAENDTENRRFYDAWEQMRKERLLPLLEQTATLFNDQAAATDLTAEAKPENGSIYLKIIKSGKKDLPLGSLSFKAAHRKIYFNTYESGIGESQSETFDLYTLDFSILEAKMFAFIRKVLELNFPQ